MYSYTPLYDDELEFKEGEVIEITNTDNPNWYFGRLRGKSGLCPTNYLADDPQLWTQGLRSSIATMASTSTLGGKSLVLVRHILFGDL